MRLSEAEVTASRNLAPESEKLSRPTGLSTLQLAQRAIQPKSMADHLNEKIRRMKRPVPGGHGENQVKIIPLHRRIFFVNNRARAQYDCAASPSCEQALLEVDYLLRTE